MSNFFNELRRRRVFRTAGLYVVAAWVVLQVGDLAFESWDVPAQAMRYLWIALLVLFPLALLFGWRYDITASGIVRTPKGRNDASLALQAADYGILAALGAIVVFSAYFVAQEVSGLPELDTATLESLDASSSDADPLSIAILPFDTRSNQDETSFFADGMHDDLLTSLANVSELKVISRTSVLGFRDSAKSLREIADELGVANILEGGVQAAGDNVRINVQLIDARTDEHLWAATYDRRLTVDNLFAIHSEIVERIAGELAATLTVDQRRRINVQPTDNMEAYRSYILGKNRRATASFEALRDAEAHFRDAIALDPDYVMARVGLADVIRQLTKTGAATTEEMIENGFEHIDYAIRLDPFNGYAQAVMGTYESRMGVDDFEARFSRALALSPNNVDVLQVYAAYLRGKGRYADALTVLNQALELDPLSVLLYHDLGGSYIALGRFAEGRDAFFRISQINPNNPFAVHGAAQATIMSGQVVEAGYWSDAAAVMDPEDFENPATSVIVYGSAGNLAMAEQKVAEALALGPSEPFPLAAQVFYLHMSGQPDRALAVTREALAAQLDNRWGSDSIFLRTVRDAALLTGDYGEALAWYEQRVPRLFSELITLNGSNIEKAADLGHLLLAAGKQQRATYILQRVVDRYDELYTVGAANFPLGAAKAQALVLLDRPDEALAELQRIVDDGWRIRWRFNTELNPSFETLRDNPQYKAIISSIERDIERQNEAFANSPMANKAGP
jgi:TolB-like protein/Tfp pilus assembly protein PilF